MDENRERQDLQPEDDPVKDGASGPRPAAEPASVPGDEDSERHRLRVTGADPWVPRPHHAPASELHLPRRPRRAIAHDTEDSTRLRRSRRQSFILGGAFAALALAFFLISRATSPRVVVELTEGSGVVMIDGVEAGRTGEVIGVLPGRVEVTVVPDVQDAVVDPPVQMHTFGYSWQPARLEFTLIRRVPLD